VTELRDLLDEASRPQHSGATPQELLRAGRDRVRRRALARTGVVLSVAVLLCASAVVLRPWDPGADRGVDPAGSPTGHAATQTPRRDPSPPSDVDPDHTPPGTELRIGETALVPIDHIGEGEVELTVTDIRRGANSEMTSVLGPDLAPSARRGAFWYVDVRITYVSGGIGGYYLDPDVATVVSGGRQISQWNMVSGDPYAPCPSRGLPLRPRSQDSVEDCLVFQTQEGAEVTGLEFGQFETPYDIRTGDPVVWR